MFFSEERNQEDFPRIKQKTGKVRLGGEPAPRPRRKFIPTQGDGRSRWRQKTGPKGYYLMLLRTVQAAHTL